jgi:hypothetical protein
MPEWRFVYALACRLGVWNVEEMLAQMSTEQLHDWMAYAEADPFTEQRADWRAAMVASTVANAFRGKQQRSFQPSDFMPKFGERRRIMTAEQMKAILKTGTATFNAMKGKRDA